MKSAVYHGAGDIRLEDVADPCVLDARDAIVRLTLCGLCGSDLHPYHVDSGHRGYCIGHEGVGEIVDVGAAVKDFRIGDRVFVSAVLSCGDCERCRAGLTMLCEGSAYPRIFGQGVHDLGGLQAELARVPVADDNLFRLERGMSDELGVLLADNLPTGWACARAGNVTRGATVAVLGLGTVGLQTLLAAAALGAQTLYAIDPIAERRAVAAGFGGRPLSPDEAAAVVMEETRGRGVDCVLDAAGGAEAAALSIALARKGATIGVVGVSEARTILFPTLAMIAKNIRYNSVSCSVQAQQGDIRAAFEDGRLDAHAVTAASSVRFGLSRVGEAYAMFDARNNGSRKVVLIPGQ